MTQSLRWRRVLWRGGLALLTLLIGAYLLFTGPRHLDRYPPRETSPYRLPWPAGLTRLCSQSNRGVVSHRGWGEYAYDFNMPVGSDVCAARGGVVTRVIVRHEGHGLHMTNNLIAIDHGDGTVGWYLHLQKDGSLVRVGERVALGQKIARSGHVGRSLVPHLHFQVTDTDRRSTLPVTFADVLGQGGAPRMFFSYTSGNSDSTASQSPPLRTKADWPFDH
jgi:murein DD-endopeptidase MepM/ murein hydrolase activator NlpD